MRRWRRSWSTSYAARSRPQPSRRLASAIAARQCLEDIATLTGGKAITEDLGLKLENIKVEDLGKAKKITIDKDNTTIIEGGGTTAAIEGRVKQIRAQIEDTTSDYDREKLQERLAKLVGGVAVIKVGAATETEMKEKKARVEDAMHATKAAVEEGIVPGGGVALMRAANALDKLKLKGDQFIGLQIIKRAIEEPMRWIAINAGEEGSIVVAKVRDMKADEGFNAATDTYEDLVKAGVIDPAKVVRNALQNASSIASLLLTTEALIPKFRRKRRTRRPCHPVAWAECTDARRRQGRGRAPRVLTANGRQKSVSEADRRVRLVFCTRRSLPDDLHDDLTLPCLRVELEQHDLLPSTERQDAAGKRDRQRGTQQRGAHMAGPVVVAPPQVVAILPTTRRQPFEESVEIGDRARLELDGRDARSGPDDEDGGNARASLRGQDSRGDPLGDIPRITLSLRGHLELLRRDHAGRISRPLIDARGTERRFPARRADDGEGERETAAQATRTRFPSRQVELALGTMLAPARVARDRRTSRSACETARPPTLDTVWPSGYCQRSIACRCNDSGGSSASSMRSPFTSVMFDRMALVSLLRISDTSAPRCLNIAVAASISSTWRPK